MSINMNKVFYKNKIIKLFSFKIIRYALIGAIATIIHLSVSTFYIAKIDNTLFVSNVLGFLISYIFSYVMQSKMVFEHAINVEKAIKYFIVQFSSLLLSVFLSDIASEYNNYLKTVMVIIMMPIMTFFIHKMWTFKTE
ncbi:MAG: GtrA family protein [Sulfurovum sp.]|nr:MAG: GtrA family protein [Sulfurovum sp.]